MRREPPTESELFPGQEALHIPVSEAHKILTSLAYPHCWEERLQPNPAVCLGAGLCKRGNEESYP